MKTRIDVERIRELREELRDFNRLDLRDVELCEGGVPIEIRPEILHDFQCTGLANMDFVDLAFWKDPDIQARK